MNYYVLLLVVVLCMVLSREISCENREQISEWQESWRGFPATAASWSLEKKISEREYGSNVNNGEGRGKFKVKKRFKKFLLPLLLAYKLKFFTLIPVLISGLVLLTGATGLAGFFFALFAAVMGLRSGHTNIY